MLLCAFVTRMDLQLQLVFQEGSAYSGHGTVMKPPVHMISVNQRSIVNPVADKAALSRFYRSLITGTLEPTVTFVWPLGVLVL